MWLLPLLVILLSSCNTVPRVVYVTKTVVPDYYFPDQPELNEDVIIGKEYYDHVSVEYLRNVLMYFTLINGIEVQYNLDKEYYDELNRHLWNTEENRQP
jgi:hypothetical protein